VFHPAWRDGGVYVVLGGAGGLGVALSEYLIRRYQAQLVWLGRRPQDETIAQRCAQLGELGPTPLYLQADGTDREALELARATIHGRFGTIHGLVHSAVATEWGSLAAISEEAFTAGISAKAVTTVNLDAVFGADPLDFVLFFASLQSFSKTSRPSNYAAGCCYVDAFAHNLQQRRSYPVKMMHWGYWGSVGQLASEAYREH
jgi:NAD(P)-dependent dehydrogenase (short-subunit alcohol dehydrogenase family)